MGQLFFFLLLALVVTAAIAGASAAPWLPTKPSQRRALLARLPMRGDETVVDLGCGDGSLLFAVLKRHPRTHCVGVDISLLPLCIGWTRKLLTGARIRLRFANLFTTNIREADVVFVFLLTKAYARLKAKFAAELRDDARVVVEAWPLPGIEPGEVIRAEGLLPVYIYEGSAFRK